MMFRCCYAPTKDAPQRDSPLSRGSTFWRVASSPIAYQVRSRARPVRRDDLAPTGDSEPWIAEWEPAGSSGQVDKGKSEASGRPADGKGRIGRMSVNRGPEDASAVPGSWDAGSCAGCCTVARVVVGLEGSGSWIL